MFLGDDENGAGDGGVVGFSFEDGFNVEVLDMALQRYGSWHGHVFVEGATDRVLDGVSERGEEPCVGAAGSVWE